MLITRKKNTELCLAGLLEALVGALLLQAAMPAFADQDDLINPDRPGIADGSNVVGASRFQIETGLQQEFRRNGALDERRLFVPTLLRIGLNDSWEARIESNVYGWMRQSDAGMGITRSEGTMPVSLGAKYHFQDSNGVKQPSLGAILRIFPASGSKSFRTRHATGDIRMAADWDFATNWSLNPNVGLAVNEDSQNQVFTAGLFAMTLNYNPNKTLNFFVDTGVQSPEEKNGKSAIIYDAGVAYLIGRDIQLDFSVGTGAVGATPPRKFVSAGISMRF
jgi:Putative MetA-pathway of phenol degradation